MLDSGPLGMLTNPNASPENMRCRFWLRLLAAIGMVVVLPEIADYEIRREFIRARKTRGLRRLEELRNAPGVYYLPLTSMTMLRAAELWAIARQRGTPTADDSSLDVDVILAAQAQSMEEQGDSVTVATTNVRHISFFVHAAEWQQISD
ncbi:MAG: nucleic acid-binding protein [Thermomicrobiales bacterium]